MSSYFLEDEEHISLCEALDRVLHKGVVIHGDIVISVAGIDLVYLGVRLLLSSVDTAMRAGINPTANPRSGLTPEERHRILEARRNRPALPHHRRTPQGKGEPWTG